MLPRAGSGTIDELEPLGGPVDERVYLIESYLQQKYQPEPPPTILPVEFDGQGATPQGDYHNMPNTATIVIPAPPVPITAPASWQSTAGFPTAGRDFTAPSEQPLEPFPFYYANMDYVTAPDDPDAPSGWWDGRVINPGTLARSIGLTSTEAPAVETTVGQVVLSNADAEFDTVLDSYSVISQNIAIKVGNRSLNWRSFVTLWILRIIGIGISDRELTLDVQDPVVYTTAKWPVTTYNGLGGIGGGADLAGVTRPVVFGQVWNFNPTLIDAVRLIYQFNDGPMAGVDGIFDGGVPLTFLADHPTYTALSAAAVTPGYYSTCLAEGCVKVGSRPVFDVTGHVRGLAAAGTTTRSIATHVASKMENDIGLDIDIVAFGALPAWTAGWAWREPFTYQDVLNRFVGDAGFHWGALQIGPITVGRLQPPAADPNATVFDSVDMLDIERVSLPSGFESVHQRRIVRYQRNWFVQSSASRAETAVDAGFRSQEWRTTSATVTVNVRNAIDPPVVDTCLANEADALALAQQLLALHGVPRKMFSVESKVMEILPSIAGNCRLRYPRLGLSEGPYYRCVAINQNLEDSTVRYLFWG